MTSKFAVGVSVWFCSQTIDCTIDAPNCMLWLPFNHVVVFSTTLVDASRDDCVEFNDQLVNAAPVPQHAPLRFRR